MDPWSNCQNTVISNNINLSEFEDSFVPEINNKLPDHEKYLAALEAKLQKLKSDPDVLKQFAAKRELYMNQLLNENSTLDPAQASLEDPVTQSQLLRTILPQKQALNQGELVELIKYDELSEELDRATQPPPPTPKQ